MSSSRRVENVPKQRDDDERKTYTNVTVSGLAYAGSLWIAWGKNKNKGRSADSSCHDKSQGEGE